MRRTLLLSILIFFWQNLYAPPNCEIYKNDENCYRACHYAMKAISYSQGSYQSQAFFDKSIETCPTFSYSYMEKAVPYLKRGKFVEWKQMIDEAVALSPEAYLGYRAWCRLQFLRDYEGAIEDLEKLKSLVNYDIGYCQTGDYHLDIVLALCYKEIGDVNKARKLYVQELNSKSYSAGLFDYYHIGVLEYETGNYSEALAYLDQQIKVNGYLAETYYYKALVLKRLNQSDLYEHNLKLAENYYRNGKIRSDTYTETLDKIYLTDILEEKALGFEKK